MEKEAVRCCFRKLPINRPLEPQKGRNSRIHLKSRRGKRGEPGKGRRGTVLHPVGIERRRGSRKAGSRVEVEAQRGTSHASPISEKARPSTVFVTIKKGRTGEGFPLGFLVKRTLTPCRK